MQVTDDMVVSIHYELTLDAGEVVDTSFGREPLAYLHGHGNIVPGLERELTGKKVGDKFAVKVEPKDGYGERDPNGIHEVLRAAFSDDIDPQPGMELHAQSEDGTVVPVQVVSVQDDTVTLDANHQLAGENLNFAIEVMGVRKATAQELEHGHVHQGGHDH